MQHEDLLGLILALVEDESDVGGEGADLGREIVAAVRGEEDGMLTWRFRGLRVLSGTEIRCNSRHERQQQ